MRLFAQHVDFIRARAPERDLERHPREHRNDRVDDFVGQARKPDDGDRQAPGRDAKEAGDHLGDVVLDHQSAEHEPIARIAVEALEPVAQRPQIGTGEPLIEHAEPFVDDGDDVDNAIGRRRIGGHGMPLGGWLPAHRARSGRRTQFDQVFRLCDADDLVERIPLVRMRLPAAEHDVGQFVEPKHPERQLETFRIDDLRQPGKMGRVFVVRIKDDDAELRPHRQRLFQQEADRSRLADAGRPQNGEMTPDQFADVDLRRDVLVLAQPADFDPLPAAKRIDGPKIVGADAVRGRAQRGKRTHAAMEKRRAVSVVDNLAVQLDRHAGGVRLAFGPPAVIGLDLADRADQTRGPVHDGDEMADRPVLLVRPRVDS